MDKEDLINKLNEGMAKTTNEVIGEVMEKVKPSQIRDKDGNTDIKAYNVLNMYRNRWKKGETLGHKALSKLFGYFGYKPVVVWVKEEDSSDD